MKFIMDFFRGIYLFEKKIFYKIRKYLKMCLIIGENAQDAMQKGVKWGLRMKFMREKTVGHL